MVGFAKHGLSDMLGEGLNQNIFAAGDMEHTEIVGQTARSADKTGILGTVLERIPDKLGCFGIDTAGFMQNVRQRLLIAFKVRACNDFSVRCTQKDIHRLPEIVGSQQIPQVIIREIQTQKHPYDFAVVFHRSVKYRHHLVSQSGSYHIHAAFTLHSVNEIVPVPAVAGLSVGG